MNNNLNKRLVMTFKTTDDKSVSLTIDNPREDITEDEIKTAMELVVSKNIFAPGVVILLKLLVQKWLLQILLTTI